MSKVLIKASEGSNITGVYSDDGSVELAMVTIEDQDPSTVPVKCDPEMITEYEARVCFTSDDLPDDSIEEDAA